MKTFLLSVSILLSTISKGQSPVDSAVLKNLSLRANTIALLIPKTLDPSNDSLFMVFIKWRASLRANPVIGNTTITIDSIPTTEMANMYDYILGLPGGLGVSNILNTQISAARTSNPYFNRLCQAIDDKYALQLANMGLIGRKLALGR